MKAIIDIILVIIGIPLLAVALHTIVSKINWKNVVVELKDMVLDLFSNKV